MLVRVHLAGVVPQFLRGPPGDPLATVNLAFELGDEFLDSPPKLLSLLGHRAPPDRAYRSPSSSPNGGSLR